MHYKSLLLDKFQEDAIRAIEHNHSVVVSAPTGSGKTLIADYIIDRDINAAINIKKVALLQIGPGQSEYKPVDHAIAETILSSSLVIHGEKQEAHTIA